MKAIVIFKYGSSDVLSYQEVVQEPSIKANQVLVKVYASSVNPVDWKVRRGEYKLFTGNTFPKIIGVDLAGIVEQVGTQVTTFRPGDQVYGMMNSLKGGAYAEYAAVDENKLALKPKNLSFKEAAAVPVTCLTAYQALYHKAHIQPRQRVLINGASGGVGSFAIQLAKLSGALVSAVCSAQHAQFVKELGADEVIDYRKEDFTKSSATYDTILDVTGNKSFGECMARLSAGGIYISTKPNPANYMSAITSNFSGKKAFVISVDGNSKDLQFLTKLIEQKSVKPIIEKVYPLKEAAAAHEYGEKGHTCGKIVIEVLAA
jgi:NADPH:quinone reductase-like Zn-dependent oxidoreductase